VRDSDPHRSKRCDSESILTGSDAKTLQRCSLHHAVAFSYSAFPAQTEFIFFGNYRI